MVVFLNHFPRPYTIDINSFILAAIRKAEGGGVKYYTRTFTLSDVFRIIRTCGIKCVLY